MRVRRTATTAALGALALSATLAVPATAMADTTATPTATTTPASACDALPDRVKGKPADLKAGSPGGDYIWHDSDGWHLRVTHATHTRRVYTGVIHSQNAMTKNPVALEKADSIRFSADRKTLTFRFVNYGYIDGVDFTTDCSQALTFALRVNGMRQTRAHVFLGANKVHPAHVPFTIRRHATVTPTPTPTPTTTPVPAA